MKKNLFVLMLSTFVLTNAQQSYAMQPEENENSSSRKQLNTGKWVPQAPVRSEGGLILWEKKAQKYPQKYKVEGRILFIYQYSKITL